MMNWNEGRGLI